MTNEDGSMDWRLYSTNAKEIGTLYLVFAIFAGMIATGFSVLFRLELSSPGVQFLQGDHQLFNVIITAHGLLMLFFMVKFICTYETSILEDLFFNVKFSISNILKNIKVIPEINSLVGKKIYKGHNHPAKKYEILNPFNNRFEIAKVAKEAKGVYIFEIENENLCYVGSSINLYNRVCSYFMPSILSKADRRVLRYFNEYGFDNVKLILYILDTDYSWEQVLELEQYYIDLLSPGLNVDSLAGGYSGYHTPMSQAAKEALRKTRGTSIYLYDNITKSLIYISESKQWLYDNILIHHTTLDKCIVNGKLYLNRFYFSLDIISELPYESILTYEELILLIENVKSQYKPNHSNSKTILAENMLNCELNSTFSSIGQLAKYLKGDRGTIRSYISGKSKGLYRKQWKFTSINSRNK